MKTFIVMPAYNEEKRIGKTLELYSEFFEKLRIDGGEEYEILVSINGTTDGTLEIVKKYANKNNRIIFIDLELGGKGYAIIEGFKVGLDRESDLIGFVDSDGATSPDEFWRLVKNLRGYSGAVADRYIRGSRVYPPNTFRRLVVSRTFNLLIRSLLFLPNRDTQCGAKVFRREVVEKVLSKLSFSHWAFDVDLIYNVRKLGFSIRAVPTVWIDKEYSKINFWKAGPWMALGVLKLRIVNSPFKSFVRFYDFLLDLVKGRKK